MNQPEHELARKIVQILDHGADQLKPEARERLFVARNTALSTYREQPEAVLGLAWAGQAASRVSEYTLFHTRQMIALALLVLALAGIAYWQTAGLINNDVSEIDVGLLTDELPLNAYIDKGFDSWLRRSPR
jgi:hypothetical protein